MAAIVNTTSGWNQPSGPSVAATAVSHTTGNLIVVTVRNEGGPTTVTVTDTAGNTYTPLTQRVHANTDLVLQKFYAKNIAGNASNVVTANFTSDRTYKGILVQQASGCDTTAPYQTGSDQFGQVTAGQSASCSLSPASGGVVVSGVATYSDTSYNGAAGYTLVKATAAPNLLGQQSKVLSGSGSETPAITTGANDDLSVVAAFFKDATAGGAVQLEDTLHRPAMMAILAM